MGHLRRFVGESYLRLRGHASALGTLSTFRARGRKVPSSLVWANAGRQREGFARGGGRAFPSAASNTDSQLVAAFHLFYCPDCVSVAPGGHHVRAYFPNHPPPGSLSVRLGEWAAPAVGFHWGGVS